MNPAVLVVAALLTMVPTVCWMAAPGQIPGATESPDGEQAPAAGSTSPESAAGITLLDGKTIPGQVLGVEEGQLVLSSHGEPVPFYEIQELRFDAASSQEKKIPFERGPLLRFRSGETLAARVLSAEGNLAKLKITGVTDVEVPVESLLAFRLREAHGEDSLLEDDLERPAPSEDTLYARRGASLLRIAGIFRGLSPEYLSVELDGNRRRIRRQLVQGVIFAPVASKKPEADPPATFELVGAGRLPGYLAGIARPGNGDPEVLIRFPGASPEMLERLPTAAVRRITFASDRVQFLSAIEPVAVENQALLGRAYPYRKDLSVSGDPMRLGGRTYRRGLGVHSRCVLDYPLGGEYRAFAAVIGLDDSGGGRGSVTFRVLANGKELFKKEMQGDTKPEPISLPMDGVQRLRLEVDYGADGLDIGDHADWADARVSK